MSPQITQMNANRNIKDGETYVIIGAAMAVHSEIGHGFFEAIYQGALKNESQLQNIPYAKEKKLSVYYRKKTLNVSFGTTQLQYKRFVFNLRESADT